MPRPVVLVEGASDRIALLTLASRLGRDLSGLDVVAMGGITNLRRHLTEAAPEDPLAGALAAVS